MRDITIDRTPEQFAELMSPVCKTLTEISERARSFGLARSYGDDASISYYPRREQPWYQWIHGTKALKGRGAVARMAGSGESQWLTS